MNHIEEWLYGRIGLNFRSGLGRMKQAIDLLEQPQQDYPIIHVTGTNGKGSTIAFMRELFSQQGKKVGSFTSPHMVSIHDRICINGRPISDRDFIRLSSVIQKMEETLLQSHDQLSYFEILTLIALLYFKEEKVDLALIEVGIGGLLDTTNVVTGEIAIITSIGLDHQDTLGATISDIAQQKAGIFKDGKVAILGPLPKEAIQVCELEAKSKSVYLYQTGRNFSLKQEETGLVFDNGALHLTNLHLGLEGSYQVDNASLAIEAFWLFCQKQDWAIDESKIFSSLSTTRWMGRLEAISQQIYIDGAHNLPAIERLVDFIRERKRPATILFAALKRKDYQDMLAYLKEMLPEVELVLTSFNYGEAVTEEDITDVTYVADYRTFIRDFEEKASEDQILFVTGSLYFIAEIRSWYMEKQIDRREV
ncbi:Dihydrofolate synthase / Folylpolyglutamate synthase [Streptococcus sp. DD10]|uniref:bifunctional folylpolyglutamate synthase/dihydrofolate synthase n=1 Tax=Streptococcus sp. DD10 TaxID=1777878 RepID=UPI00079881D4|nr:folylpolyglutamate synthase/dihydrofolate synthase family protein [Streptococcus sp. DD10]KXT72719.1 Dihydrofolate synthase / Folylpolyglutamate synthase [Streptococcus sp. DD10]